MATVTIHEATTTLSDLIARAEAGEEIVIARRENRVVRLEVVAAKPPARRKPGRLKGKVSLPDSFFFDPLPEEELRLWEGRGPGPDLMTDKGE